MSNSFRALTKLESQAIEKMLSIEFEDAANFKRQVASLSIKTIDETLFQLCVAEKQESKISTPKYALPIEGSYADSDGQTVYIWLWADREREIAELEFWKPSGEDIFTYFADANLSVKLEE